MSSICGVVGCGREMHAKQMCVTHYNRKLKGLPETGGTARRPKLCSFPDCGRRMVSRGLCSSHAWQRKNGNDLTPIANITATECTEVACTRKPQTRGKYAGLCSAHARHKRQYGEARELGDGFPLRDPIKFWSAVAKRESGCWEWQGSLASAGYGTLNLGGGKYGYAHRYSWELMRGDIADGLDVDHLCRNRRCVNPAHLEPVTHAENVRRGAAPYGPFRRTCRRGHDVTIPENIYTRPNGSRMCRECISVYDETRKTKRRGGAEHDLV